MVQVGIFTSAVNKNEIRFHPQVFRVALRHRWSFAWSRSACAYATRHIQHIRFFQLSRHDLNWNVYFLPTFNGDLSLCQCQCGCRLLPYR